MSSTVVFILMILFTAGALLAAWAGIRSIQSARSVVFYRTRQSRMMAGWTWLAAALVFSLFGLVTLFFSNSLIDQILSASALVTASPASTSTPLASVQTETALPSQTQTRSAPSSLTPEVPSTAGASVTPSRTPAYVGTFTAFAVWTERRSTFIARLSETPTASRTPIPTWTRTPSSTPRPTYTPSATRTPRTPPPTWTPSPAPTGRPTLTPSLTQTPRPTLTPTATPTRTHTPTRTVTLTPTP